MSIKNLYKVLPIKNKLSYDWLLNKHYAKRIPSIIYAFGLYKDNVMYGVCTFGMPPSSTLAESIAGQQYKEIIIELNRLVIEENLEKNVLSYFVSQSINLLPKPKIIVSFSDLNIGHNGYIYQACNFLYTGKTTNITKLIDLNGDEFHFRNIGHYQKNNKLKVSLIKRRINEEFINKLDIATYLKNNKGKYSAKDLDAIFNYKDTCSHWFRTDKGFSFPSIDDWIKLKEILNFDNTYDKIMTSYELIPDSNEIIKKLQLRKIEILPKNRYIYIHANKYLKKDILSNLKLRILNYPKEVNKRYNSSYKPVSQTILF